MVNYQTITALVNQIPAGTWDVLRDKGVPSWHDAFRIDWVQETSIARTGAIGTTIADGEAI
jgi:hypothetical protein